MGLDSIWKMPDGVNHPAFEPALDLCGGHFSGSGRGSFRGKVYNEFIEHVSGISLYQEEMSNCDVVRIADALSIYDPTDMDLENYDLTAEEVHDLYRMFTEYGDAGATLIGWW